MTVTGFLCVIVSISSVLLQCSVHANNNFELKNDLISSTSILLNDTKTSSTVHITEFSDPQKKIIAHKNEISGECVLKPINDQAEILSYTNKYNSKMELSENEMVEIIGENIKNFCDGKVIILNNIDDGRFTRSKRSTDKKRYQGQTQTQFVSFGSKDSNQQTKNGLAEALSQPDLSRATVSGLNGMGQAQSQSSFGDCDECSGHDSRTYPNHVDNSHIENFPLSQPQSYIPQNRNTRPNGGSNTNRYSPGLQYDGSNIGHINGPYPGSGTNNETPGKQDQGYVNGPSINGQYPSTYPGSQINNERPSKQDQGYYIGSSINGKYPGIYPGLGITHRAPDNQNQGFVTKPFTGEQYPDSGTNNGTPGKQDQGYVTGPSINGQYPSTYPGSGTNHRVPDDQNQGYVTKPFTGGQYPGSGTNNGTPGKQDQGYDNESSRNGKYPGSGTNNGISSKQNLGYATGPSINGQYPSTYPGSGTNNVIPGKQDQGYDTGSSINGKYPGSETNHRELDNQNQGYVTKPFTGEQYPVSVTNNGIPSKQNIGYATGPSINGQYPSTYPGSGTNNAIPGKQDQRYATGPSINGQYPSTYSGSGTNNGVPGKQDQGYDTGSSIGGQYPNIYSGLGTNNRMPDKQNQVYATGPSINEQYPSTLIHNKLPGSLDQGYISTNEQIPISVNLPESKKPGNTDNINQNIYSVGSSSLNPSGWNNPNKETYSDGSGFPSFPSGSAQGILAPHNTPNQNYERTNPRINQQVPTSIESQNKPTNFAPSQLNNYPHQAFNELDKLKPIIMPTSGISNSQNSPIILNEAVGIPPIQNVYPLPWNTGGGQGFTQVNLPSLCNYLYQTCLNALSNNKKIIGLTTGLQNIGISQQNNARNQFGNTRTPSIEQPSSPLHGGGIIPNQLQPDYRQPQGSLGSGGSGVQQSGYPSSSGNLNPNQVHPGYDQSQDSLGTGVSGVQQSGYPSSSRNVKPDQVQPGYGPSESSLGSGGSSVQPSGHSSSNGNGNLNQGQLGYRPPQGSLSAGGSGVQQSEYPSSSGNVNPNQIHHQGSIGTGVSGYPSSSGNLNPNQVRPGYGLPQGSIGAGGTDVQQSGYPSSSGNIHPNQVQPQDSLGTGVSGIQQSGYPSSSGNVNPNQIHPQGSLGTGVSSVQQSGYPFSSGNLNPNKMQPDYGQPQGSLGAGGSGVQQSGYPSFTGNVNPNQMQPGYGQPQGSQGAGGSGVQQSGYPFFTGNVNPNQMQPGYGQSQGSQGAGGSGVQQSGYPSFTGNGSPNLIQPQGSLGAGGSDVQQSRYPSSSVNLNPNQVQSGYGQSQGSLGGGEFGVQQFGYPSTSGNLNPNQIQPQSSLGAGGSGVQQSGYPFSSGNLNPNQMQPGYGQPQGSQGAGGSGIQQSGYPSFTGNVNPNQMQPGYGQPQGSLGVEGSGVQQPVYGVSGGSIYPNSPSSFQSGLDGKGVPGNNPQSYGDNYYRGPQFGPGNNYPSTNPIIDGQFGSDVSSGGSVTPIDTEGGDAQSMTNVNVDGKETSASASAQGKSTTGMTQTQVSGTYSGTGTFSAQAQTSDSDKGAQSHIVSNTNGTTSTAQGKGGKGQAQSQVLYNADSGVALGEAQSSGINYGTNTQLQAGIKGGVADAQSTGPGSTSSQAQIGFLPYESNNDTSQKSLFKGGGTASSQGGHYSGQSQSQLFGSYKYGISYNGAAQASSGKKLQNLPKLNLNDAKSKIEQLEGSNNEMKSQTNALQLPAQSIPNQLRSQTPPKITNINSTEKINSTLKPSILPLESHQSSLETDTEYDDSNDEYEDENDENVNTKSAQTKEETNPKQIQNIILNLDNKHDAQITRDSDSQLKSGQILDAGQIIPGTNGTKIPDGFRGRVASVAGDHTEAKAIPGGQAQTQTVLLTPGVGGLTVVDKTNLRALLNKESYIGPTNRSYNRFQTDTNGETGQFKPDDKNVQYFTKSSTCGYFSFSCNYVNGAQSGPKICKPNPPPIPCKRSN